MINNSDKYKTFEEKISYNEGWLDGFKSCKKLDDDFWGKYEKKPKEAKNDKQT